MRGAVCFCVRARHALPLQTVFSCQTKTSSAGFQPHTHTLPQAQTHTWLDTTVSVWPRVCISGKEKSIPHQYTRLMNWKCIYLEMEFSKYAQKTGQRCEWQSFASWGTYNALWSAFSPDTQRFFFAFLGLKSRVKKPKEVCSNKIQKKTFLLKACIILKSHLAFSLLTLWPLGNICFLFFL